MTSNKHSEQAIPNMDDWRWAKRRIIELEEQLEALRRDHDALLSKGWKEYVREVASSPAMRSSDAV